MAAGVKRMRITRSVEFQHDEAWSLAEKALAAEAEKLIGVPGKGEVYKVDFSSYGSSRVEIVDGPKPEPIPEAPVLTLGPIPAPVPTVSDGAPF